MKKKIMPAIPMRSGRFRKIDEQTRCFEKQAEQSGVQKKYVAYLKEKEGDL